MRLLRTVMMGICFGGSFWLGAAQVPAAQTTPGATTGSSAQPPERLIFKDGTYETVLEYKVEAGRVRYLTPEAFGEWAEADSGSVDWAATRQWNKAHAGQGSTGDDPARTDQEDAAAIDRAEAAQRNDRIARSPEILPGLRLPDQDGIFALDSYQGSPELIHLEQADGDLNQDPYHSVHALPLDRVTGAKNIVHMASYHAAVQMHVAEPAFFVSVSGVPDITPDDAFTVDTTEARQAHASDGGSPNSKFFIVRAGRGAEERVLNAMELAEFRGRSPVQSQTEDITPTTQQLLAGKRWLKIRPAYPLDPGEYVLLEMLPSGDLNTDVWDFGVDPHAPENHHPVLPLRD